MLYIINIQIKIEENRMLIKRKHFEDNEGFIETILFSKNL